MVPSLEDDCIFLSSINGGAGQSKLEISPLSAVSMMEARGSNSLSPTLPLVVLDDGASKGRVLDNEAKPMCNF